MRAAALQGEVDLYLFTMWQNLIQFRENNRRSAMRDIGVDGKALQVKQEICRIDMTHAVYAVVSLSQFR
jgi:hypothetical protein